MPPLDPHFPWIGNTSWSPGNPLHQPEPFGMANDDRRTPTWIIGKTGTGKSTQLANLIIQDLRNGHGVGVIDPHGDLVSHLLNFVPRHRSREVVYFNPQDSEFPVGFNILTAVDRERRRLAVETALAVFKTIWGSSWGPRLEHILRNSLLTLMEIEGATLLAIPRLLSDPHYRSAAVARVQDAQVRVFWEREFAAYTNAFRQEAISPVLNKVGAFLANPLVRNVVGQVNPKFELGYIMDKDRIFFANLSKGLLGSDPSRLLGSLFVISFFLAALKRASKPEEQRRDFYLYIDESHSLAIETYADLLSEVRKYRWVGSEWHSV
jgi:hypothetical protein